METGLYNYGERLYDPPNARWLNRDPIGEQGGVNLYSFCSQDAINKYDYLGQTDIGQVLNSYFTSKSLPDPGPQIWFMGPQDNYTQIVRKWAPVKDMFANIKSSVAWDPFFWKYKHNTLGYYLLNTIQPRAVRFRADDPAGTGVLSNLVLDLRRSATGFVPEELNTAAIGSFSIFVTVDYVDDRHCKAKLTMTMRNTMSQASFSQSLAKLYQNYYQHTQYMYWTWKEEFNFAEVPGWFSGTKMPPKSTSKSSWGW